MDDYINLIITLVVTLGIGACQIYQGYRMAKFEERQDKRDEKRRDDEIYAEATRFIQKYTVGCHKAEIYLLPLCIVAYKYNPIFPYSREIYREFCGLSEDVQNFILTRFNIDIPCNKSSHYFSDCLDELRNAIKEYCPGDKDIFYDNGKYLKRALFNYGEKEITDIQCAIDEIEQEQLDHSIVTNSILASNNSMEYETHITNLLAFSADTKPISRLVEEPTSLGTPIDNEFLMCYLCCVVAKYIPCYLNKNQKNYKYTGNVTDYTGTMYMEDEFLLALHSITICCK